jgi:hypothetical protein
MYDALSGEDMHQSAKSFIIGILVGINIRNVYLCFVLKDIKDINNSKTNTML